MTSEIKLHLIFYQNQLIYEYVKTNLAKISFGRKDGRTGIFVRCLRTYVLNIPSLVFKGSGARYGIYKKMY